MNAELLTHWNTVAAAAERAADPENPRDTLAVMSACMMADHLAAGRPVPAPTPELNANLFRAEELAARA